MTNAGIVGQRRQPSYRVGQPFVDANVAVAIQVGIAATESVCCQRIGQQALSESCILECDIVRLGRGKDANAFVVGQLAQPAISHRPRLEAPIGDARSGMTGIDHQCDLASLHFLERRYQVGGGEHRGQVRCIRTLRPATITRDQVEIALRVCPTMTRVADDHHIVWRCRLQHAGVDAVGAQCGQGILAVAVAGQQRQHSGERGAVDACATAVGMAFAGEHQHVCLVAGDGRQPCSHQARIGHCVFQAKAWRVVVVDPDRKYIGVARARCDRRARPGHGRGFALDAILVECIRGERL